MKEFNYKDVGAKIGWNFSKINPTVEQNKCYNYYQKVVEHISPNSIMLDVGCGSAEKAIRYFSLAKKVYETDIEPNMLEKAKENVQKYYSDDIKYANKFGFKIMDCDGAYDFSDDYFDLVVSRHCGANMAEVYRVLKKDGVFLSEDYSCDDCSELKQIFGRGQGYRESPLYKKVMSDCLDAGFSEINFLRFEQIEYYQSADELKFLLSHTPILNGYDDNIDDEKLQEYVNKFTTKKGIMLRRRLYAFELKK